MSGLFGGLFDLNHNGKHEACEKAAEFAAMEALMQDIVNRTELEESGLDPDELEYMSVTERRCLLEGAGLDPDEYDF